MAGWEACIGGKSSSSETGESLNEVDRAGRSGLKTLKSTKRPPFRYSGRPVPKVDGRSL